VGDPHRGEFAGWGGLQPWDDEVELALVLKPEFWGWGRPIFEGFVEHAFEHLALTEVMAAVPPTRGRGRGLLRLGFSFVRTAAVERQEFLVYQLDRGSWPVGRSRRS
jgi:[ribosomal protein S5]-alanine N-acetyltransferase